MHEIIAAANVLLPLLYLVTWGAYLWLFLTNRDALRLWSRRLLDFTVLVHVATVVLRTVAQGRLPMSTTLEFLSLLALALMMIYAVIEHRLDVRQTGFLVTGLALIMQVCASAIANGGQITDPLLEDPGYAGHALLVVLAYAALSLSFLYAILYLLQIRQLSRKQFGLFFRRMPPLETLERMSVGAAKLGVPLLFGSLCLGHLWLYSLADRVDPQTAATLTPFDPKILASWVIFLGYAAGLVGHRWWGWRGRRMNVLAIAAYLVVIATMSVIDYIFPSFHDFTQGGGV
ncbi:cytochrome c biogenesis protein [bacterium]|nr:cytochrome c biogenesis protein [bacterium]MBU1072863.1 cytochrome c biogenesis protein [bacterium]MBU1676318.1 cytochrome c biogenesis protein [bacterium]